MRIVITGASSGFGLGTARLLAERGHQVVATVRNPDSATALNDLRDGGLPISVDKLDIRDAAEAEALIGRIVDDGGIDALINNAGASIFAAAEATSIDQMRDLMETNFFGAVRLIQLVLPHMRSRRQGRIINIGSLSGIIPLPYVGIYGATKHALDAMSFSLAAELRDFGIRVSIIAPSGFKTAITDKLWVPEVVIDEPIYDANTMVVNAKMSQRLDNDPAPVIALIADTLTMADPPVRRLVGGNAETLSQVRRAVSDDEWLDHMRAFLVEP